MTPHSHSPSELMEPKYHPIFDDYDDFGHYVKKLISEGKKVRIQITVGQTKITSNTLK